MKIHVVGVAGTGMGALAGLLAELGHDVSGSDVAFDPPMGPALGEWGIKTVTGFDPAHQEALDRPAAGIPAPEEARGEHARFVDHQQVPRID